MSKQAEPGQHQNKVCEGACMLTQVERAVLTDTILCQKLTARFLL